MQKCAEWLECDGYEQPSIGDTISGLVGVGNYKAQVCAISGLLYNGTKIAGAVVGFIFGGFFGGLGGMAAGNQLGQALECLYVWMKSGGAKKKAEKYHICLDELSQGHPLPYTDRQIAKLLDLMNKLPTVENIVDAYDKLCVRDNYGRYDFLPRGTIFDDVIIDHAPGYIYVLCASVYSACPCVYNIQHGTLEEPDYITDENGAIVMENGELQMRNKEKYQKRYAKHCRIMRFRDLYEQTNDLPNIFHFSCNDMVGYSKGRLPITAPIVQCIEGTARNIFEMPILGTTHITTYKEDTIDYYKNDYTLVNDLVTNIENIIGVDKNGHLRRTETDITNKKVRDFTIPERINIYHYLRDLWKENNATKIDYTLDAAGKCIENGYRKYAYTQSNVTFLDKYFDNPAKNPMMFCCEPSMQTKVDNTSAYACTGMGTSMTCVDPMKNDYSGVKLCESDSYITTERDADPSVKNLLFANTRFFDAGLNRNFPLQDSAIDNTSFTTADIFRYYEDAKHFRDNLKIKYQTISKIYNAVDGTEFQEREFKLEYTLFDIFRNRIKAIAGIFLVLWLFIIGWKFINGDTKLLKQDEFLKMFIKMALCWLIVFDDGAKNQLFRLVMQVAQGSVMAVDSIFSAVRNTQDNVVEKACLFGNNTAYAPTVEHVAVTGADAIPNALTGLCSTTVAACDKRTPTAPNFIDTEYPGLCYGVVQGGRCEYYALTCKLNNVVQYKAFHCERHLVRDGTVTDVCLQGHCDASSSDFIPVPPFSRPYKYYVRKDHTATATGGYRELKPKCCSSASIGNKCDAETEPRMIYSQQLNQAVYVCLGGQKMSAGYKLADLITTGIIENTDDEKRVFFQLYNEQMAPSPLLTKTSAIPVDITELIVPTSVASIDMNGRVTDLDFIDAKQGADLYQRFQYSKYLVSKVNAANAKANYPNVVENGFWHNYAPLGFWDKMDCKIVQYLTFSMSGNGLDNTLADAFKHIRTGDDDALVVDLLNGMLQIAKFLIIAFPFGVIAFCLFFALGVTMFMMLARATQKYCVCIFNLVLTIYLSPVVFIMYLFDATKKAFDTFVDDIKANITGSIAPFITLSMFLFVLDWLMFGDDDKYVSKHMFSGDGVSSECYDGEESDAPIACLTRKLLDRFKLVAIFQMFIGRGPMVEGITYKMMWYLLLRLLIALVVFLIMMSISDAVEASIQKMIGAEPDTKIGIGFEDSAREAYKSGFAAGKAAAENIKNIYVGTAKDVGGLFSGSGGSSGSSAGNAGGKEALEASSKGGGGSVSRGGLNDIGMGGANMDNLGGKGGGQSNAGGETGISDAISGVGGGGGGGDYQKGYNDGLKDGSNDTGTGASGSGKKQGRGGVDQQRSPGGGATSIVGKLSGIAEKVVDGVSNAANKIGEYSEFVATNIKTMNQKQEENLADDDIRKRLSSDNDKKGGENKQQGGSKGEGSKGEYGVQNSLLDDMRSNAVKDYIQNKGSGRSGVPKDSNNDGRDDKGRRNSLINQLYDLVSNGDNSGRGSASNKGKAGPVNMGTNKAQAIQSAGATTNKQNVVNKSEQQTKTSKENKVTNETIKGQDKVNARETRVYINGNNNDNKVRETRVYIKGNNNGNKNDGNES